MKIGAVVQARMGSMRLPGKVLLDLNGRPLLAYLLERLERASELDGIVVATSDRPEDDAIARFCEERGASCFQGSLDDVAARFIAVAEEHSFDAIVRVNGDSPLLDQRLVDRAVERFRSGGAEVVTNVFPRSFPPGQSVEVVSLEALRRAHPIMSAEDREHVTTAIYSRPDEFEIAAFDHDGESLGEVSLAVDSTADARLVAAILERMDRPHWEYDLGAVLELRAAVAGSAA